MEQQSHRLDLVFGLFIEISSEKFNIGKILGFLGLTADVTGFELDSQILLVSIVFASFMQLVANSADKEREERESLKRKSK